MKLLIVTQKVDKNDDVLGFFHGWIAEFAKHYEKVTVIALGVGEYDLPQNVEVFSLGKKQGNFQFSIFNSKIFKKLKYTLNFYKYIFSEINNYDTVFVHMNPEYVVLGGLFWRFWHKKIGLWYMHKSVNLKLKIAEKFTHTIFSATHESFRLKTNKLCITGHGIDVNKFSVKSGFAWGGKIITIGRISPIKDYSTLIGVMNLLKRKSLNVQLDIIGGIDSSKYQDYLVNLKQRVKEEGLEGVVNFIGPVPNKDIANYLHDADVFVNTSQTGSLDKAILEAMACGLVVFSSNDSAMNVFGEYQNKLFFKPKDELDLAQKISEVIVSSEEERKKIGLGLSEIVGRDHNLEKLIEKIIFIYQRI